MLQPVDGPVRIDLDLRRLGARVVSTDGLDDPAVARAPGISHDDSVRRLLPLADAHQPDLDHASPYACLHGFAAGKTHAGSAIVAGGGPPEGLPGPLPSWCPSAGRRHRR